MINSLLTAVSMATGWNEKLDNEGDTNFVVEISPINRIKSIISRGIANVGFGECDTPNISRDCR